MSGDEFNKECEKWFLLGHKTGLMDAMECAIKAGEIAGAVCIRNAMADGKLEGRVPR